MITLTKTLHDPNGIVSKLIFEDKSAIAEAVVYKYQGRGVICFSVQSGCPVGCVFCGTGNRFIRDLSADEMDFQIRKGLEMLVGIPKIQIMSMSMGEPMLVWDTLKYVIRKYLGEGNFFFVSTAGLDIGTVIADILHFGAYFNRFGLQFSLHAGNDEERMKLFRNKSLPYLRIEQMIDIGRVYNLISGNLPYFNYIVKPNSVVEEIPEEIRSNFHITCSVECSTKGLEQGNRQLATEFAAKLSAAGAREVSIFDPAGQDTIGGGCGQLLYVQEKLKRGMA